MSKAARILLIAVAHCCKRENIDDEPRRYRKQRVPPHSLRILLIVVAHRLALLGAMGVRLLGAMGVRMGSGRVLHARSSIPTT